MSHSADLSFASVSDLPNDELSWFLNRLHFTVNRCGHQHDDPAAEASTRVISDFELIRYRGGEGRITIDGVQHRCEAGSILVIPPYVAHEIRTSGEAPHDNHWVHFDVTPIYERDRLAQLLCRRGPHRVLPDDDPITRVFALVEESIDQLWRPGSIAAIAGLVRTACSLIIARNPQSDADSFPRLGDDARLILERTLAFAGKHLSEPITVNSLAGAAGCSRSRLFSVFSEQFGKPPMSVIRWMRVRHAEQLLRSTTLSVKEISAAVGITSQFHLSRLIKEHYGISPRELRSSTYTLWTS